MLISKNDAKKRNTNLNALKSQQSESLLILQGEACLLQGGTRLINCSTC